MKPDDPLVTRRDSTIKDNPRYAEGVYIDKDGNADFSLYSRQLTPEGSTRLQFEKNELRGNRDMKHDTKLAREKLKATGLTDAAIDALESGHTWHHVQGGKALELVPTDLHQAYHHRGGSADIRGGNWFAAVATVIAWLNPFANSVEAAQNGGNIGKGVARDAMDAIVPDVVALPIAATEMAAEQTNSFIDNHNNLEFRHSTNTGNEMANDINANLNFMKSLLQE